MTTQKALLPILAALCASTALNAQSSYERELESLDEQRSKAVAAAIAPIDQRYRLALEQLMQRATQNKDLETALKIKQRLGAFPVLANSPAQTAETFEGDWTVKVVGQGKIYYTGPRILRADHSIGTEKGSNSGTWSVTDTKLILRYSWGGSDEYYLPIRAKAMKGKNERGQELLLTKSK